MQVIKRIVSLLNIKGYNLVDVDQDVSNMTIEFIDDILQQATLATFIDLQIRIPGKYKE